jgi:trigger factor
MDIKVKKLPKSEVEVIIDLTEKEFEPHLNEAAKKISEDVKIEGFRPGNAPYDLIKQRVGEAAIYETAFEMAARRFLAEACEKEKIEPIGQPKFELLKLVPGNPVSFKVTLPVIPRVLELADLEKIEVKKKETKADEKEVDKVLADIQKMQMTEKEIDREAKKEDKVLIDMEIMRDGVVIEGGAAKNHSVYLSEAYYVPGFADKLVGIKKDETREFTLKFPADHYQKTLAGAEVVYKVKCLSVWELVPPELDDKFAAGLGQKSMADLRDLIKKNVQNEMDMKEAQRQEIEMLEKIVEKSEFEDMPELLLNREVDRMIHELEHNIAHQGMNFEDYLKNINKSIPQLKLDLAPQAIKRIKVSLVIKEIGDREKVEASDKEVAEELEKMMNENKENPEQQKTIRSEEYADYIRALLKNRKVIELLKGKIVK